MGRRKDDKITTTHNSWLGSKCGFGGDAKNCTFIPALVVAKQDSFSFVRTCAKPRNVMGNISHIFVNRNSNYINMKKVLKIISITLLSIVLLIAIGFYFLIDANLPKLKTDKLELEGWDYSKINDLKLKRQKADSLFNLKDYLGSELMLKSIIKVDDYELKDLIRLSKIYSHSDRKDSLLKYFNFYVDLRNKNPISLLYATNNINVDTIIDFRNYKNDSSLITLKYRLKKYIIEKEKGFDTLLLKDLKGMLADDQNSRTNSDKDNKDLINQKKLGAIIKEKGIPTISKVGTEGIVSLFAIIQHSNDEFIEKYFVELEKLTIKGEFPKDLFAYLIDRRNMWKGIPQVFGTQITLSSPFSVFTKSMKLWPIADEINVDLRRYTYGLEPIEEYKKTNNL